MTMIPIRTTHNYDAVSRFHTSVRLAHAPTIPTLCVNIVWHILLHVHVLY